MPIISAGTSAIFTIPVGKVANVIGTGVAVLVYPASSPISINGVGVIGPFETDRIVTLNAQFTITYEIESLAPSEPFSVDDVRPTRAQAQDGMSEETLSSPLNVAQQIAATLPPSCTIMNIGTGLMTSLASDPTGTGSSVAPGLKASTNITIIPAPNSASQLMFVGTITLQLQNIPPDALAGASVGLYYFDGTNWLLTGDSRLLAIGGLDTSPLRSDTVVTLIGLLPATQRRSDSGAWAVAPYVQSVSGGRWAVTSGSYLFLEIEGADTTTAAANVEEFQQFFTYGQSLGAGQTSTPPKTTTAVRAGRALMPVAGVRPLGNQGGGSANALVTPSQIKTLVDLLEKTDGTCGESPSSAAAWKLTGADALPSYSAAVFVNHSIGGLSLQALSQGTLAYQNILTSTQRSRYLARRNGIKHRAASLFLTQGESNRLETQDVYLGRLLTFQSTLSTDVRAIDRGVGEFPVFLDQLHNWTGYDITESAVPLAQLQAALDFPGKFYLVGPKYMLQTSGDKIHLTADASAWLGAYQGEIARRVLVLGEKWLPTHIQSAVRNGTSVILNYYVPNGSLVMDTTLVSDPGNNGFRWIQTGGNSVTVSNVAITGPKQITLTLSAIPTGTAQQVGYADIGVSGAAGGPLTGPRGNVHDQATATGLYGETLYNWAVVQRKDVS